jgi:molecular chaperone GrpE (heat shock protein)
MISAGAVVAEIDALRDAMEQVFYVVSQINERETSQEKVFNTLHDELRDYKTDFIYEHLKPVVRSLLFLYDSLEQFDVEVSGHELPAGQERRGTLSPSTVRENIGFFRDQLVETLQLCEVARMETPEGVYNPKLHKVIEAVPVESGENNVIQRVLRSGWYLNGQLLRPAEVVISKTR